MSKFEIELYPNVENPNTSIETLYRLADDKNLWIQYAIKNNPKTPQYLKDYLKFKDYFKCYV